MSVTLEVLEQAPVASELPEAIADNPVAYAIHQQQERISVLQPPTPESKRFRDVVVTTAMLEVPADAAPGTEGYQIFAKNEGEQPSRSYKIRGAANALHRALDETPHTRRVVAASTGNHGASVSQAAAALPSVEVTVMCPANTSPAKLAAMAESGATVDNRYATLPDALAAAQAAGAEEDALYIHPFNAVDTIAGQGTIAHEVIADLRERQARGELDLEHDEVVLFLPGAGGGCAAGNAVVVAANCPNMRVVVTQMKGCDGIVEAQQGRQLNPETVDTSCDGAAVATPGAIPMEILSDKRFVDHVGSVERHQIGEAMRLQSAVHETPEPAGALAFAGMLQYAREHPVDPNDGRRHVLIAVTSGTNVTPQKISEFSHAEFEHYSQEYLRRPHHGLEEILQRQPTSQVASAAGHTTCVASGAVAFLK